MKASLRTALGALLSIVCMWQVCTLVAVAAGESGSESIAPVEPNHRSIAPHLQVWYRADALRLADGQRVHVWPDQSGRGRDLSVTRGIRAGGVGTPPQWVAQSDVNRRPAVRFEPGDGLAASPDNRVDIRGDASFTIVLVATLRPIEDRQQQHDSVFGLGNPAHSGDPGRPLAALIEIDRAQDHQLDLAGGFGHDASLGPGSCRPLYGQAIILAILKSPGPTKDTTRFFVNGEPSTAPPLERQVSGPVTVPDIQHRDDIGVFMGKALGWCGNLRGDVAEAIVYNAALDDSSRAGLEAHLAEKFAITLARDYRATRVSFSAEQKSHWAFQPVRDIAPPGVSDESWVQSPIDRFIVARLEAKGLKPSPRADKRTLIRRVTFDLTGLPPTPEEIDALLKDESPDAFAKVVNRLLDSKHYGERWGRHWLDVVRYAESTANDANAVMRYAYRYRDYVIDAFNRDLPFDQFVIEQLAGDLMPPTSNSGGQSPPYGDLSEAARRVIATGYLMIGPKALAETDKEQSRLDIVDDQIDVTGRAFLGLTLGCARCHDHKFDPIPTADYYALAGIFRSTEPFMDEVRNATMWWEFPLFELPGEKPFMVMAPKEGAPRNLRVHLRGNHFTLGQTVPRGFIQIVSQEKSPLRTTQSGRLELARWIASRENPLTARVMVNRIWQHHFGVGPVATSDNLGRRGEPPTHPELLDYLASRFIESGWSVKAMHRLMVLSSTYQQVSDISDSRLPIADSNGNNRESEIENRKSIDPDNRLLWRMPRRRLSAEETRDAMLVASGQLDRKIGGGEAAEVLFQKSEVIDAKRGFAPNRLQSTDPYYNTPRRTVYLPVVRNALPDMLALFDAADPNGVTCTRSDTTVPSQALFLMNNSFVRDQSAQFARSLLAQTNPTDDNRVYWAHVRALGRPPSVEEVAEAIEYVKQYATSAKTAGRSDADAQLSAWQSYCQTLVCSNEFLYID